MENSPDKRSIPRRFGHQTADGKKSFFICGHEKRLYIYKKYAVWAVCKKTRKNRDVYRQFALQKAVNFRSCSVKKCIIIQSDKKITRL